MSTPKPKRPDGALTALCEALNLGKSRVTVLLREGMPDDPAAAVAWKQARDNAREIGDGSAEALRRERITLVREQAARAAIENKIRLREFVDAGEVRESMTRVYSAVRGELLKLPSDCAPRLEGLSAPQIQALLRGEIIAILTRLSDENSKLYQPEAPSDKS